jgi:hypothetical protein
MRSTIGDGTGNGYELKVDKTSKAHTRSVSQNEQREAAEEGDAYIVGSGVLTLCSTCQSAMLYLKNNESRDLVVRNVIVHSNGSTNGTECVALLQLQRNPTALAGGASTVAVNNNFGSSNLLTADITAGAEAATLTGGTSMGTFYIDIGKFFETNVSWIIPRGSSVGILLTPPPSNTSLKVAIVFETYLKKDI